MTTAWNALAAIAERIADRSSDNPDRDIATIIRSAAHCDAVALSRYNPITEQHETATNVDYPRAVLHHLNTWFVDHDEVYRHMRSTDRRPLRWRDMPFRYETMFSAERVFMPSGFNEGVSVCLYNREGRYTGVLHVSATNKLGPPDDAMQLLAASQTVLGSVVDWWAHLEEPDVPNHDNGIRVVVDRSRRLLYPPTASESLRCVVDEALSLSLPKVLDDIPDRSFLTWHESTFAVRARVTTDHVVLDVRPEDIPGGLTPRELEVSSLLARGWTNPQIAEELQISAKTASRHVENIVDKLDAPSRTAAAIRSVELGLRSWHRP